MKIDDNLLKFPKYLPNDLEGLMFIYPEKFPPIIPYFEEVAHKIAGDPQAFRDYGDWAKDELWKAYYKVEADYKSGDQADLSFLLSIDQRFNKLYCYRFWVVNYLFPDGPLHDFLVDNLKNLIRKFIDVTENIEEFEQKVVSVQRDLLQSEYADLYLQQALDGHKALNLLTVNPKIAPKIQEAMKLIDEHNKANTEKVNDIWSAVYEAVKVEPENSEIQQALRVPLGQVEMRGTMLPLYNMLTHAVEFREENQSLAERHGQMGGKIDDYKAQAKAKLSTEDYDLFIYCYEQARNFSMYKDVMGKIDGDLLPVWFGLHKQMKDILVSGGSKIQPRPTGPSAVFQHLVWYLPAELKDAAMSPDFSPFTLEAI